mmetsp:Transcript_32806/g.60005  ORF Transcript_32806/g.60005 Transcript_32806/m.60005 type:complete len:270 (+) Transcript_32806:53-862(+)
MASKFGRLFGAARRGVRWAGVAGAGFSGITLAQTIHCRMTYKVLEEPEGRREGLTGERFPGKPVRLLFVGDSICTGIGTRMAAPLQEACAEALSRLRSRPVLWRTVAVTGADVRELHAKLGNDERKGFDMAVVFCGVNDGKKVLQGRTPSVFRRDLADLCADLQEAEPTAQIAVPRLQAYLFAPLMQQWPMKHLVRIFFDRFEAEKIAVAKDKELACPSPHPDQLASMFSSARESLWASDGVHPSAEGYRVAGEWLASVLGPLGATVSR